MIRNPRVWAVPVLMIIILSLALPACYLSGITDPSANLRRLPVALVVSPQQTLDSAAESVAAAVRTGVDPQKIKIISMSYGETVAALADDQIYAAVIISPPVITVMTNAGAGNLAAGLVAGHLTPVLTASVHEPYTVRTVPDRQLPAKSGSGLTPFYLALVTILIGFIGASTVHPSLDAALGFTPSEFGPLVRRAPYRRATRTATLLAKFAVLLAVAPIAAALLQFVATAAIGVPIGQPLLMWLLLTASIAAVGVGALSVFAVFGSPGALINTFFFVALSLAAGPAVPAEALPGWLHTLTSITAMQPILGGIRALLFYDGRGAAGLTYAWTHIAAGGLIGLALGLTATWLYDRNPRFSRQPLEASAGVHNVFADMR